MLDMAENRARISASPYPVENLLGLFLGPCLQHSIDLLIRGFAALQLTVLSFEGLGVRLGLMRVEFAGRLPLPADRALRASTVALGLDWKREVSELCLEGPRRARITMWNSPWTFAFDTHHKQQG